MSCLLVLSNNIHQERKNPQHQELFQIHARSSIIYCILKNIECFITERLVSEIKDEFRSTTALLQHFVIISG